MLTRVHRMQAGDTLIEVLFAVSVFSLVAVAAISLMNSGINTAQKALEITQVRQQIDAQAEALRFVHHGYVMSLGSATVNGDEWNKVITKASAPGSVATFNTTGGARTCGEIPPRAFIMNARLGTISTVTPKSISSSQGGYSAPPFARVTYDGNNLTHADGIWIEGKTNTGNGGVGFTDFHIRACWESPGTGPAITLGTIVRLYEPPV